MNKGQCLLTGFAVPQAGGHQTRAVKRCGKRGIAPRGEAGHGAAQAADQKQVAGFHGGSALGLSCPGGGCGRVGSCVMGGGFVFVDVAGRSLRGFFARTGQHGFAVPVLARTGVDRSSRGGCCGVEQLFFGTPHGAFGG